MAGQKTMYCDFHFVVNAKLKKNLLDLRVFRNVYSFSGIVVKILQVLYPRLEKEHFSGRERYSRYQLVTPKLTEKRCHVHVYLPMDLYRRLKLIHQDLNFYSMAQCLRWLIRFFLDLVNTHRHNLRRKLTTLLIYWRKQNSSNHLSESLLRQLKKFRSRKAGTIRFLNLYNSHFSPMIILKR